MAESTSPVSHWEADVVLRDGGVAHVRPIRPEDADDVAAFHAAQSEESRYLRFFAAIPRLSARDLARFTQVDQVDRVALVATVRGRIVGIARWDRTQPREAEVAFNIADAHQGRGLGSVLLEHLAAAARERGVQRFTAEVLPANQRMLTVFGEAGYEVTQTQDDGITTLTFDIDPTARSLEVMRAREHRAEALSLRALLRPASVVVVGASRDRASVGYLLLEHLVGSGFTGPVHAVNPEAFEIGGVTSHARVADVPGPVELAVVAVPAEAVVGVVRQCADAGVRAVIVVSSGFAETGPDGLARQRELVRVAHGEGLRLVGPNSFGVLNTSPQIRLNASLAPHLPPAGGLGLFSQSGALGVAVLAEAEERGVGVSTFVSAGNRADVSGNDSMQFWEDDDATVAVGLYLESMGNPRKFSRIARRLARTKPVIVMKSGTSGYGVPPGHAVRPSQAPRAAFESMLRQAGVIRVESVHHLFDVAQLVVTQPLPAGPRVALVGNSDALLALAADACVSWGLQVVADPVAVPADAPGEQLVAALDTLLDKGSGDSPEAVPLEVDSVVAVFVPPLRTDHHTVAVAPAGAAARHAVPTVACFLATRAVQGAGSGTGALPSSALPSSGVPAYPTPEDAVRALAAATRYGQWRRRDPGVPVDPPGCDVERARELVAAEVARMQQTRLERARLDDPPGTPDPAGQEVGEDLLAAILDCYGLHVEPRHVVHGVDEAVAAATEIGWPVALKASAEHRRHRADLTHLRLHVSGPDELREDARELLALDPAAGLVVQRMVPPGVPCRVESMEDPLFGPVVSFGLAGDASELLGDIAYRVPPLTDVDVGDLITSVRAAPRLFGYRGAPPADVAALADVVARVSRLADDLPQVRSLRLDPVLVGAEGAVVLDARLRLAPTSVRSDTDRRSLTS